MKFFVTLAALAAVASAITITEPKLDAKLDFSATNSVKWTHVESDPAEFQIALVDQSTSPETVTVLAPKVKSADKEYKLENVVATPGTKYKIKFFAVDNKNSGQLVESQSFAVTKSGVKASTTPAPSAAPTNTDAAAASSTSSKAGAMATAVGIAGPVAALLAFLA
ncbi:hypothetical protein QBC37DRAFT_422599 [Rhypophila decipiens]|uniref:Yeast cell wall synthesis Kre9/Knh1-like N-terminal domain-containing protein n=1 Tax=Rhypophila decipiens TaxID=261697 RepID=A0AAN6YCR8_9PEZI|nr:hypothetical protein QBC37DRAFT_422599 [Rhypophila decipiens]